MTWSVLGVDQSPTSTGWAHLAKDGTRPIWGMKKLDSWTDNEGERLWEWMNWLGDLCRKKQVTHLFLENTFAPEDHHETLTNKIGQYGLIGMGDMVRFLLGTEGQHIAFRLVASGQWRPVFIGTERAPKFVAARLRRQWLKDRAVAACLERGWVVENDNMADALGIMNFGCMTIDPVYATRQGPLFRRQELVVERIMREG